MTVRVFCAAFAILFHLPLASAQSHDIGLVPIGSAVPYFRPLSTLPAGWMPCHGETVRDSSSPLHGQRLPDLRHVFVRGADSETAVGKPGGSDALSLTAGGIHDHDQKAAGGAGDTPRTSGVAGLHRHSGQTGSAGGGLSSNSGLPGGPGAFTQQGSAHQHTLTADLAGNHSHGLPPEGDHRHDTSPAGDHTHSGDNRPRHVEAHFICRIR
ncbi:MAG: hypothetical protein VW835_20560 [Rickettsiales bacterium]